MDVRVATRMYLGAAMGIISLLMFGISAGFIMSAWNAGTPDSIVMERVLPLMVPASVFLIISVALQRLRIG